MAPQSSFQPTSCPEVEIALSTEDIAPLYIPPRLQSDDDLAIQRLLADGPPSPRSARAALDAHGTNISRETALAMVKKLAQLAEDRDAATKIQLHRAREDANVASQAHLETTAYLEESLTKLKERLAELESHLSDPNTGAPFLLAPHCPPHFVENHGLVPDFYICEDGMRLLARYVCRIPGTNMAQGTLGGNDARIYTHELQALPSIVSDTPPDVLPLWFVQSMAANQPAFHFLIEAADALDDWGLSADIQYYHDTDVKLEEVQSSICELQAEADTLAIQRRAAHYRLARANAGMRLASVEAISPFHQEGSAEGGIRRGGKARGRAFGK